MIQIFKLIMCHLVGDYVLQSDFIAQSKGANWYHLFVHCALYILPFCLCFGWSWYLGVLFVVHIVVDSLKARWHKISYTADQVIHYATCAIYFLT